MCNHSAAFTSASAFSTENTNADANAASIPVRTLNGMIFNLLCTDPC